MHKIGNFSEFLRGKIGNFAVTSVCRCTAPKESVADNMLLVNELTKLVVPK